MLLGCVLAQIIGCKKHPESFGRYADLLPFVIAGGCTSMDQKGEMTSDLSASNGTLQCGMAPYAPAECSCDVSGTIYRAANWDEVDKVDVRAVHCDHVTLVLTTFRSLEHFFAPRDWAVVKADLEKLGTVAPSPLYVTLEHSYGDVTMRAIWSRDAYRSAASDKPDLQTVESLYVSLTPRRSSDRDHIEASNDPHIVPRPRCN